MFSPFVVKHSDNEFKISDANFVKKSPKLFMHWYYKRRQSFTVDKMYPKEAVSYMSKYLNGDNNLKRPVNSKDIIEVALSLGCVNLLIELFANGKMREAIDCYEQLLNNGAISEEYENMLTKMMNESDDYLEASSLPIECLARLCRGLSTKKRIELARAKGGQSACLLLVGIDLNEISPNMMADIGEIEGWTESRRLSEHYSNEMSILKKEHREALSKIRDEMEKKDQKIKKRDCQRVDLVKLLIETGADIHMNTKIC